MPAPHWIFVGDGMTWTQAGTKLTAADEIGSGRLGASVALSAPGGVAVVGAPSDDGSAGAVSVYARSADTWTPLGARIVPSDESGTGRFGSAVAVSGDGRTLVAGAPDDNGSAGAIWTFAPGTDGTFAQTGAKITAATTGLGTSLAIDTTGATVLAGAPGDAGGSGAGIVFAHSGESYVASAVLFSRPSTACRHSARAPRCHRTARSRSSAAPASRWTPEPRGHSLAPGRRGWTGSN